MIPKRLERFLNFAADYLDTTVDHLLTSRRTASLVRPRHVAMSVAYSIGFTLEEVAEAFNRKAHGAITNACERVKYDRGMNKAAEELSEAWARREKKVKAVLSKEFDSPEETARGKKILREIEVLRDKLKEKCQEFVDL